MQLASDSMTYRMNLDLVTGARMQVVDGQTRLIGGDSALLLRPIPLVVHFVSVLMGVRIAAPTHQQALVDAAQFLDDGSRRSGVADDLADIGGHATREGYR